MSALLDLEAPEEGPRRDKFVDSFNLSYEKQQLLTPSCNADARITFDTLAAEGQALAEDLNTLISNAD